MLTAAPIRVYPETPPDVLAAGRRYLAARAAERHLWPSADAEHRQMQFLPGPIFERWRELAREADAAERALIKAIHWRPLWFVVDDHLVRYPHDKWRKTHIEVKPRGIECND